MRQNIRYLLLAIIATVWSVLCFILPDFSDSPINDFRTFIILCSYVVALGIGQFLLLDILMLNRYAGLATMPIYAFLGGIISYYRYAYHATLTPMVLDAAFHTNAGTIAGVTSWQMVLWTVVQVFIGVGFAVYRFCRISLEHKWWHFAVAVPVWLLFFNCNDRLHNSLNQRYPYNIAHCLKQYAQTYHFRNTEREAMADRAVFVPDSIDIVVIIGEALRADHLSLNGYERQTCPRLSERRNVYSYPIYSPYTHTAASLPYILTPADSLHPERAHTCYSFIQRLNDYGFRTSWVSNQDNSPAYSAIIYESDTVIFPNAEKSVFVFNPWYDSSLLPPLDQLMCGNTSKRNLYVLHTIGSHWYYNNHVTTEMQLFQPVTENRIVTDNRHEQVVNSYDNTVLYADMIADSIIQRFEQRCAVVLFISDHGEALGEEGKWLHANNTVAAHYPACFVWYSDKYAELYPALAEEWKTFPDNSSTDIIYHKVLSAAGIEVVKE